jgi:hypothetical protein
MIILFLIIMFFLSYYILNLYTKRSDIILDIIKEFLYKRSDDYMLFLNKRNEYSLRLKKYLYILEEKCQKYCKLYDKYKEEDFNINKEKDFNINKEKELSDLYDKIIYMNNNFNDISNLILEYTTKYEKDFFIYKNIILKKYLNFFKIFFSFKNSNNIEDFLPNKYKNYCLSFEERTNINFKELENYEM